ncbi:MAG: FkbM family methyltransferase [Gammaproteobacteria bacterium]|nr:FkbM family methyltransferase [Gammaproteobacteria bacterium]
MIKTIPKTKIKIHVETDIEQSRYDSFWTKEPETIKWIESFESNAVFLDIGANIGLYSLYCASLYPDINIYAYEPMYENFKRFKDNISLNKFSNITVFNAAISNTNNCMRFEPKSVEIGSSGGQLIKETGTGIYVSCTKIDDLWLQPDYIKIDIDGQENKVIEGAMHTIKRGIVKSWLIEFDDKVDAFDNLELFIKNGYTIKNEFQIMHNHSRYRRAREGIEVENVVFTKK